MNHLLRTEKNYNPPPNKTDKFPLFVSNSNNNNICATGCQITHCFLTQGCLYFHRHQNTPKLPYVPNMPKSHLPSAAVLHIHLIRSINPPLLFCCCSYGSFSLSGWFTAQDHCAQEPLEYPRRSRKEFDARFGELLLCVRAEGMRDETAVWLMLHWSEVTGSLWCDPGIKCQWVFDLSDSAQRCCWIRSCRV